LGCVLFLKVPVKVESQTFEVWKLVQPGEYVYEHISPAVSSFPLINAALSRARGFTSLHG
jgi:hypothetical protein